MLTRMFFRFSPLRAEWVSGKSRLALPMSLLLLAPATGAEASPPGPLPSGAQEVSTNRFRSPLSFRSTLTWYEKVLRGGGNHVEFGPLIDLPDVVAAHGESRVATTPWSGLNVSEFEGSVWIFFIPR